MTNPQFISQQTEFEPIFNQSAMQERVQEKEAIGFDIQSFQQKISIRKEKRAAFKKAACHD